MLLATVISHTDHECLPSVPRRALGKLMAECICSRLTRVSRPAGAVAAVSARGAAGDSHILAQHVARDHAGGRGACRGPKAQRKAASWIKYSTVDALC